MIEMYAIIAAALVAGGVAFGIVVSVSLGIRCEEKAGPGFAASSPGGLASTARAVNGLYVRTAKRLAGASTT